MKKLLLPVLAATFALAACDSSAPADTATVDPATDTSAAAPAGDTNTTVVVPTATETVVVDPATAPKGVTIDGKDVDATISDDGVTAKVKVD